MSRKAFIFGSNYIDTPYKLSAPVGDCIRVAEALKKIGYEITKEWSEKSLTWERFYTSLNTFLTSLRPGDRAIIYYSGHGVWIPDNNGDERDRMDESIYIGGNIFIRDDTLRYMLQRVTSGVKILSIFDSCHSGTVVDLPYRLNDFSIVRESNYRFNAEIIGISGSTDPGLAYETANTGLLTDSLLAILKEWKVSFSPTYPWIDLYIRIASRSMEKSRENQFPQLTFTSRDVLRSMWI